MRQPMPFAMALGLAVCIGAVAAADEPEEVFEALYGKAYRSAKATRAPSDDVALAGKILATVKKKEFTSGHIPFFCEKAYELGMKHPQGCETATRAMAFFAGRFGQHRAEAFAKIVEARQRLFKASRGAAGLEAGRALVASLLDSAEAEFGAGREDEAAGAAREALKLARRVAPGRRSDIQVRLDQIERRTQLRKEASDLQARLQAAPDDKAARGDLIHLYLVDLDDPAAAARFVDDSCEADVRKYVPAAAKPLDAAPRLACLEMGVWYKRLAEAETEASTIRRLLRRAWRYYRRHGQIHKEVDVERAKAVQAMREVLGTIFGTRLDGLGKTHVMAAGGKRFAELLALKDADRWVAGWGELKGGILTLNPFWSHDTSLPCRVEGGYQVVTRLVCAKPTKSLGLMIPVGFRMLGVEIDSQAQRCGLQSVQGGDLLRVPDPLASATTYGMEVVVLPAGGRAEVFVAVDDTPYLYWEGPLFAIAPPSHPDRRYRWTKDHGRYEPGCVTLHAQNTELKVPSVRLRMLSGTARPITK